MHDQTVIPGLMRAFNSYWNADYSPPRADSADLQAWRDKAKSMTRFDPPVCSGVAGMIIDALAEGARTKAGEIFDKYLPLCGSGSAWAKMFEPSLSKPSPAASSTDRLSRDFYVLYPRTTGEWVAVPGKGAPPPVSGMKAFEDHLANMRAIRERFRQDCIGSGAAQMVKQVRGVTVLAWPERFENCEGDARKLFEPLGLFDSNMATVWNPYWGANYSPPRGDPADAERWRRWQNGFVRFSKECEIASWRIIHSGEPGFPDSAEQVFRRMEKRCPARWIALFEPDDLIRKRELDAKKRCKPGTSYIVVDEKSGNGSREECDESDKFIPPDSAKDGRSQKKDPLADELAAIQRGEFERPAAAGGDASSAQAMLNARRRAGADLTAAMEDGVRQQPKAGSIGGTQIFGGENGQLLEAVAAQADLSNTVGEEANIGTTNGCDDAAERRGTENMQTSRVGVIRSLPPAQQECATAKLYVDIYARALAYAQRCNRRAEMPSIQGALQQSRGDASRICGSVTPSRPAQTAAPYQTPRRAPPPSRSPTPPASPSRGTGCDRCLPDR